MDKRVAMDNAWRHFKLLPLSVETDILWTKYSDLITIRDNESLIENFQRREDNGIEELLKKINQKENLLCTTPEFKDWLIAYKSLTAKK